MKELKHVIIGAGPAAMACAYELAKAGHKPVIFDTEGQPGGICRTLNFQGYLFDIGGHRFLSRSKEVNKLWQDVMGDDLLRVRRLSRIYYKKKFFSYPLRFFDTFFKLGAWGSLKAAASLLWCKYRKAGDLKTFDGWVTRNFGAELYKVFFKNYTEKVWGMPCANLSADWAMQRLRGLSLQVLIGNALSFLRRDRVKTLAEEFLYPRTGPGEFFKRLQTAVEELGGRFNPEHKVTGIITEGGRVTSLTVEDLRTGRREEVAAEFVFSTMPLPELARLLAPAAPAAVPAAAGELKFRSFLAVNVILNVEKLFPDQWLYIQEPEVRLGRIQNYKNWSPAMVPDNGKTSLGLEYFCQEGDEFWNKSDIDLTDLAMSELEQTGIASRKHLISGFVVRVPHAYPVYSMGYAEHVATLRDHLRRFENLATFGRGGLFQYDNSDHALLCGLYAARNITQNAGCDLWNLDRDMGYLES